MERTVIGLDARAASIEAARPLSQPLIVTNAYDEFGKNARRRRFQDN